MGLWRESFGFYYIMFSIENNDEYVKERKRNTFIQYIKNERKS